MIAVIQYRARTHMRARVPLGCQEDWDLQELAELRWKGLLARSCDTAG